MLKSFVRVDVILWNHRPLQLRHLWHARLGTHVRPDHAARLVGGVRYLVDLMFEAAICRLIGHVDTCAGHIELPAVIYAAQPTPLRYGQKTVMRPGADSTAPGALLFPSCRGKRSSPLTESAAAPVRSPALAARERAQQATRTAGRARQLVCLVLFGTAYRFLLLITWEAPCALLRRPSYEDRTIVTHSDE